MIFIVMPVTLSENFEDVKYRAEDLSKEKRLPVRFEWGGFLYTVEECEL